MSGWWKKKGHCDNLVQGELEGWGENMSLYLVIETEGDPVRMNLRRWENQPRVKKVIQNLLQSSVLCPECHYKVLYL